MRDEWGRWWYSIFHFGDVLEVWWGVLAIISQVQRSFSFFLFFLRGFAQCLEEDTEERGKKGRTREKTEGDRESNKSEGWQEQGTHGQWGGRQRTLIKVIMWQFWSSTHKVRYTRKCNHVNYSLSVSRPCTAGSRNIISVTLKPPIKSLRASLISGAFNSIKVMEMTTGGRDLPLGGLCPLGMCKSCHNHQVVQITTDTSLILNYQVLRASPGLFCAPLLHRRTMLMLGAGKFMSPSA